MTATSVATTSTRAPAATEALAAEVRDETVAVAGATDSAADLLNAMAAMPAGHPSPGRAARPRDRGLAAAGPPPGPPLLRPRRAHRRPDPDRDRRPDQGRRQVRPRPRRRLRRLRHPHHHRRDQAALPRPHLVHPGPAPPAGAAPGHHRGQQHPDPHPGPLADRRRHRRPPRRHRGRSPGRPRRRPRLQRDQPVHPDQRRRHHRTRRHPRRRGPRIRARRDSASPSAPPWPPSTSASRRSSPCASTAT